MMKKFALAAMLSAAMTMAAFTPAFAEASTESSTESLEDLVTFDDAVETALKDAGLDLDSVTFSKKMHFCIVQHIHPRVRVCFGDRCIKQSIKIFIGVLIV